MILDILDIVTLKTHKVFIIGCTLKALKYGKPNMTKVHREH